MIGKENIKYSMKNLLKRKSRSMLTIGSILLGIATIFIFVSFGLGLSTYIDSFVSETSADKITIQPKGETVPGLGGGADLTEDDLKAIERTSGVFEVEGTYTKVVEAKKGDETKFVFLFSFDPKKSLVTELSSFGIEEGRELSENDRGKVVLGYNYLEKDKIFKKGLELNERIEVSGEDFTIVGFYEKVGNPQDDSNIYINNNYFETIFPEEAESYGMIIARVDKDDIEKTVENVEKSLRKSRDLEEGKEDFSVTSFEDLLESFTSSLNIVIGFIILIAFISIIVSSINTANTMITSVLERVREIGVMKAIGARNSEVFRVFLIESSLLGLAAGVLGVLLGFLFTSIAESILINLGWSFLQPYYSFWLFFGCILFAVVTGAISGVVPAWNASKTNIVRALRYE